jgi:hypothetical protein
MDRVYTARGWAAPRLESAAEYTSKTVAPAVSSALQTAADKASKTVAPAVSSALQTAADKVSPPAAKSSKKTILLWSALGAGIAAGLAAAAALVRFRYRAAIAADSETADEEVLSDSTGGQAAPVTPDTAAADADKPAEGTDAAPGTDTSVNGRVNATGR